MGSNVPFVLVLALFAGICVAQSDNICSAGFQCRSTIDCQGKFNGYALACNLETRTCVAKQCNSTEYVNAPARKCHFLTSSPNFKTVSSGPNLP